MRVTIPTILTVLALAAFPAARAESVALPLPSGTGLAVRQAKAALDQVRIAIEAQRHWAPGAAEVEARSLQEASRICAKHQSALSDEEKAFVLREYRRLIGFHKRFPLDPDFLASMKAVRLAPRAAVLSETVDLARRTEVRPPSDARGTSAAWPFGQRLPSWVGAESGSTAAIAAVARGQRLIVQVLAFAGPGWFAKRPAPDGVSILPSGQPADDGTPPLDANACTAYRNNALGRVSRVSEGWRYDGSVSDGGVEIQGAGAVEECFSFTAIGQGASRQTLPHAMTVYIAGDTFEVHFESGSEPLVRDPEWVYDPALVTLAVLDTIHEVGACEDGADKDLGEELCLQLEAARTELRPLVRPIRQLPLSAPSSTPPEVSP